MQVAALLIGLTQLIGLIKVLVSKWEANLPLSLAVIDVNFS